MFRVWIHFFLRFLYLVKSFFGRDASRGLGVVIDMNPNVAVRKGNVRSSARGGFFICYLPVLVSV